MVVVVVDLVEVAAEQLAGVVLECRTEGVRRMEQEEGLVVEVEEKEKEKKTMAVAVVVVEEWMTTAEAEAVKSWRRA